MFKAYVQDNHGSIVWEYTYKGFSEMQADLELLMKPSVFGVPERFRLVIQKI